MCFKPDGSILCKVNKCSCVVSLLDNFLECLVEPGKLYSEEEGSDDDYDSDIEYEDDNAFGDSIDENMRKYELWSDSVLEVLSEGDVITLFSASNSLELFLLLKLLSFGIATEELRNENNHYIVKGNPYIMVTYFKMKPSSALAKGNIVYKSLSKPV